MNTETLQFVSEWLEKANEDFLVIKRLTEPEIIAHSAVCFHCQQQVEKTLKAFIIANNHEIRKTHNIEYLLAVCAEFDEQFEQFDPVNLSDFGVDVRYPGETYHPTDAEVFFYVELSQTISNFARLKVLNIINTNTQDKSEI